MEDSPSPTRASTTLGRPLCHTDPSTGSGEGSPRGRRDEDSADAKLVEPQLSPLAFIQEIADARTRLYSARDERGSVYAAFYADGRLRVAFEDHRLAGIVQNGHAHLLDMSSEVWSEVFVRVTPEGALQLELRDGPLDGRVLTCEALKA